MNTEIINTDIEKTIYANTKIQFIEIRIQTYRNTNYRYTINYRNTEMQITDVQKYKLQDDRNTS